VVALLFHALSPILTYRPSYHPTPNKPAVVIAHFPHPPCVFFSSPLVGRWFVPSLNIHRRRRYRHFDLCFLIFDLLYPVPPSRLCKILALEGRAPSRPRFSFLVP
jgi:hypothetical protein